MTIYEEMLAELDEILASKTSEEVRKEIENLNSEVEKSEFDFDIESLGIPCILNPMNLTSSFSNEEYNEAA